MQCAEGSSIIFTSRDMPATASPGGDHRGKEGKARHWGYMQQYINSSPRQPELQKIFGLELVFEEPFYCK